MRFLFLATKYSVAAGDPYMTDELAGGLIERGHSVDVLHLDWDAPLGSATRMVEGRHGEKVVAVAPRAVQRFGRLAFRASSSRCRRAARWRQWTIISPLQSMTPLWHGPRR